MDTIFLLWYLLGASHLTPEVSTGLALSHDSSHDSLQSQ